MSAVLEMPVDNVASGDSDVVSDVHASQRSLAGLAQILRVVGALAIVGSMSVFLLQGWSVGNDVQRYLLLLAQTALLTAAGFALSHGLKETRGARVFFGLSLVSIPANFTILGALFYSAFQLDGALTQYPSFANWQMVDVASASVTLVCALVALVPLSLLCFAIMARRSARALALHFLVLNSLLLVPARSALAVGVMALIGVLYALWAVTRQSRQDGALATREGQFALSVLFAPLIIIVVRSLNFYPVDEVLLALLSLSVFAGLRHVSLWPERRRSIAVALDSLSLPVAISAASGVEMALHTHLGGDLISPWFAITLGVLGWDVIRRTRSRTLALIGGMLLSVLIATSLLVNLIWSPSVGHSLVCVGAGALVAFAGYVYRQKGMLIVGWATIGVGLMFGAQDLVQLVMRSGWVELALSGAAIIAAASVVDRHGLALRVRATGWLAVVRGQRLDDIPLAEADEACVQG